MQLRGLIASGLLTATAAWAAKPFAWPTPDALQATDIAGTVVSGGVPMRLKAVRVKHRAEEMIQLYADTFERAGFYIPPGKDQLSLFAEPSLTALDTARLIAYTVIFQDNRDGTTTLILGESNLKLRGIPPRSRELPVFPGVKDVLRAEAEGTLTVGYRAKAPPRDVLAFYRDTLERGGYCLTSSDEAMVVFQRKDEEITVTASPEEGGSRVGLIERVSASGM